MDRTWSIRLCCAAMGVWVVLSTQLVTPQSGTIPADTRCPPSPGRGPVPAGGSLNMQVKSDELVHVTDLAAGS